ncbi:MAG: hypothetical protein M0C28_38840 [Candidatus Moduliflexus flocculans]|nr:hypothetical protein [Candidatus Moduliflexus flocculans]
MRLKFGVGTYGIFKSVLEELRTRGVEALTFQPGPRRRTSSCASCRCSPRGTARTRPVSPGSRPISMPPASGTSTSRRSPTRRSSRGCTRTRPGCSS